MKVALCARDVSCEREDRVLFDALDLAVEDGQIVRIEGPNGSGKTSLLKMLSGQLEATEGTLTWHGRPLRKVRASYLNSLLYTGHSPGVSTALTAEENLRWSASMAGVDISAKALATALGEVGLVGFEDVPARQLSAGQQRRVALARLALIPRPLWILDEPFTAIDRSGVAWLEQCLIEHCDSGGAVILTTHHYFQANDRVESITLGGTDVSI